MERVGFATGYDASLTNRDMAMWMAEAERRGYEIGFFSETIELNRAGTIEDIDEEFLAFDVHGAETEQRGERLRVRAAVAF